MDNKKGELHDESLPKDKEQKISGKNNPNDDEEVLKNNPSFDEDDVSTDGSDEGGMNDDASGGDTLGNP